MKMMSRAAVGLVGAAFAIAIAMPAAQAATGTPTQNGCPTSFTAVSAQKWVAKGYTFVADIDDPTQGGNGDGVVCQKQVSDKSAVQVCRKYGCPPGPVYQWEDNYTSRFP
jgi:hypothetical protein